MDTELVLPMYNAHPYFSLKNSGKKSAHYMQQNTVRVFCSYLSPSATGREEVDVNFSGPYCGHFMPLHGQF